MSMDNSPTFPLPSTGPTQYDAATQAGQHTPGQHPGPVQGHFYPPPQGTSARNFPLHSLSRFAIALVRSSRSNSGYIPSNVPPPHPPAHIRGNSGYQPIQGPVRNQTLQMPQVLLQETGVPTTTYGTPSPVSHSRGETMQMPDYRDNTTHLAPGPYSNYTPQPQAMSHSTSSGMMLGPVYNAPHDQNDPRYRAWVLLQLTDTFSQ